MPFHERYACEQAQLLRCISHASLCTVDEEAVAEMALRSVEVALLDGDLRELVKISRNAVVVAHVACAREHFLGQRARGGVVGASQCNAAQIMRRRRDSPI